MQQTLENNQDIKKSNKKLKSIVLVLLITMGLWFGVVLINDWFVNYNNQRISKIEEIKDDEQNTLSQASKIIDSHYSSTNKLATISDVTTQSEENNILRNNIPQTHSNNNNSIDNVIHIGNYRNYLLNANHLLTNFIQGKVYSNQTAYLRMLSLPSQVEAILQLFEEYNVNYLINADEDYELVFSKDHSFVKKFITIKKKTDFQKNREQLKKKIMENLEIFQDFIYSENLQKIFMGHKE